MLEVGFRFQAAAGQQGIGDADGGGIAERRTDVKFIILLQEGAVNDVEDVILVVGPVFVRQLCGEIGRASCRERVFITV